MSSDEVKVQIEKAIDKARDGVSTRIDEIDRRVRSSLDLKRQAKEHGEIIVGAGLAAGFIVGLTAGKVLLRLISIGVPVAIGAALWKSQSAEPSVDDGAEPLDS